MFTLNILNVKSKFQGILWPKGVFFDALPRLVIAIMENNQNANGSIGLPEALWPYMGGLQKLG